VLPKWAKPDYIWRFTRMEIAKMSGWTLDYIDRLSEQDVNDFFASEQAKNNARK
jgi:hypothetical protein